MYADLPAGDLLGLDAILAAARDALAYLDPSFAQVQQPRPYAPRSRSALGASSSRELRGPDSLMLVVSFRSTHPDEDAGTAVRLPGEPRSFNMTVEPLGGGGSAQQQACVHSNLPYADELEVVCQGMPVGSQWVATLVDAGGCGVGWGVMRCTALLCFVSVPRTACRPACAQLGDLARRSA